MYNKKNNPTKLKRLLEEMHGVSKEDEVETYDLDSSDDDSSSSSSSEDELANEKVVSIWICDCEKSAKYNVAVYMPRRGERTTLSPRRNERAPLTARVIFVWLTKE